MLENPIASGTFPYDQPDPADVPFEEDYLDEEREAIYLEDLDEYRIEDDQQANWAVKQILKDRADTDRLIALADAEIRVLQDQRKSLINRQESREGYLKALLMGYFERVEPSTATKTQTTYKLLAGKLVKKRQQPEYQRDETALVSWAKDNAPAFVQVKESVVWGELKKATETQGDKVIYKDTGEVVPGVVAVKRPDVFEVVK